MNIDHLSDFTDDLAASQHISTQLAGRVVQAIEVCSGDEDHPSHVDITFSNGVILYIAESDEGIFVGMTEQHRGTLQ